jgi:hypothetical protein
MRFAPWLLLFLLASPLRANDCIRALDSASSAYNQQLPDFHRDFAASSQRRKTKPKKAAKDSSVQRASDSVEISEAGRAAADRLAKLKRVEELLSLRKIESMKPEAIVEALIDLERESSKTQVRGVSAEDRHDAVIDAGKARDARAILIELEIIP